MRYLLLLLLLAGCSETGDVQVMTCPSCPGAYAGFQTCAFFDADEPWARDGMLVDDEQYIGHGKRIRQDGYMHHKFCYNGTHAAFGSANPTRNGLLKNSNVVVVVESERMADGFAAEYEYLSGEGRGWHDRRWRLNGRRIEQHFCPRDDCEGQVLDELRSAEESILFMAFSFTSDPIGEVLVEKHHGGVDVVGAMEPRNRNGLGSEYERLSDAGIRVHLPRVPGVMHHKAFVIDERAAILGSYNPTASGTDRNAETLVITEEPVVVRALLGEFNRLRAIGSGPMG